MKRITLLLLVLVILTYVGAAQDNSLRIDMYAGPGASGGIMNGYLMLCGSGVQYSNGVDQYDASYPGEPLIAVSKSGQSLSIEKRQAVGSLGTTETSQIVTNVFSNMFVNRSFRVEATKLFTTSPGQVYGRIDDLFLPTSYPISIDGAGNGITIIPFVINPLDAQGVGSKNPNRFLLVLSDNAAFARPFTFTQVHGVHVSGGTNIHWGALNEESVTSYEIEKIMNGRKMNLATIEKNSRYSFMVSSSESQQKIRVRANLVGGKSVYSDVVTIAPTVSVTEGFTVFPNPILGRLAHLHFNADVGKSEVSITNLFTGHTTPLGTINAFGDQQFMLRGIVPGAYALTIRTHEGTIFTQKIIVQ